MRSVCLSRLLKVSAILSFALLCGMEPAKADRYRQLTEKFRTPENPVKPVVSSLLGTRGTEWLVASDFLPDGSLALGGNVLDGPADWGGAPAPVLGRDGSKPNEFKLSPSDADGGVKRKNSKPSESWQELSPALPQSTAFVVLLDRDMKRVLGSVRLPWAAGALTDLVTDEAGNIYLAGHTGETFSNVATARTSVAKGSGFVMRLPRDLSKVDWVQTFPDSRGELTLARRKGGGVTVAGESAMVISENGEIRDTRPLPGEDPGVARAVNPNTLAWAVGSDRNTRLGRGGPWRQPRLLLETEPGEIVEMYQWSNRLVDTPPMFLISDADFRALDFAPDGDLLAAGWSHGGVTVFHYDPLDVRKPIDLPGIGIQLWNTGDVSTFQIFRINPETLKVEALTDWAAFVPGENKGNTVHVSHIRGLVDDSVLIAGHSFSGFLQTGDNLHQNPDETRGPYVAIFSPDLNSLRFSTLIQQAGANSLRTGKRWNSQSRVVNGRKLAVVTAGASPPDSPDLASPGVNALQDSHAGGLLDGFFFVIDLDPTGRSAALGN